MAYAVEVLHRAVRKHGAELHLELRPFTDCSLEDLAGPGSILRMHALDNGFEWRYTPFRIEAVHAIEFL